MKAFLLNFLVKGGRGFRWRTVSTDFQVKNSGGCTKSRFAEDLRTGNLDGEACVLSCVYLFFSLLFVSLLFACMFTFYLLLWSCLLGHASVMWFSAVGRGDGGERFWWVSSNLFCSSVGLMQDVMKSHHF